MSLEYQFFIWSEEHGAWWMPEKMGYTRSVAQAGRYSQAEAEAILREANEHLPEGTYHEHMFPTIWFEP